MGRLISRVVVRKRKNIVEVIGYSQSDRGTKYVAKTASFDTTGLSKAQIKVELVKTVGEVYKNPGRPS